MKIIILSTTNCPACYRMERAIEDQIKGTDIKYKKVDVSELPAWGITRNVLNMKVLPLTFSAIGKVITKKLPIKGYPAANFKEEFKRIMEV